MPVSASDASNVLTVQNITKEFVGLKALEDVSLELRQGEILGLIGPNGSGKTTLINVVTGLLPLTSGKIFVNSHDLSKATPYKIARAGISRTFQTIRLFKQLTVRENIEVAAMSVGFSRAKARQRAAQVIGEFGLEPWVYHMAGMLPYGRERRVEIARALAMKPTFLMLDEPAAGLNEDESDELLQILSVIPRTKELGMLIVEHDMRLIMRLCDRLHVLSYGKTIGEGTPEEVRQIPSVIEAYLGSTARGD
jgi:branched-chain amino acid transport system ATP-binding protein